MPDNEAGAFLNITPDVLKKLDSFDEKLEKIEKHAHTAADALKNGFGSVVVDTSKLESAIASLASKISSIGSKGNPFEGVSKGAGDTEKKTTSMNESLSRAADLLNRIGDKKIGQGSFSGWNIAGLKESISDLKKFVENTQTISKQQQQTAVNAMRYMKMELDYQRQTDEQRVQSAEKTAQRKEAADRRAAKAAEQLARQQEIAQRTTPQGALDYSRNAKYLRDQVTAINYLKQARLSLNTTDANYRQTLEQINQAIAKHNQALQQAGVQSQQLATRHRNLMDTAGQLSRQLALVFSVSQIEGYISKLANVRGEFELQQRSLEAILQNKAQADQIFNKTVQLAVKSPFQIKELVTFTKQLAAYRIESDKLYDTTKRLADVSAGLGVDMGRLILAYGQVKAAAYLRGTEVRQFTEAGINLYGELQRYFEEVKGEAYTTAQIVDMISKRKVTFEDIENIFKRLTDSGGLFYNMQEIQAETLQGKISNLKDSIDVMLNSIGKANEDTLKGSIDSIKVLIDNWETVVEVAKAFGIVVGSMVLLPKIKAAANGVSLLSFAFTKAETALRSLGLAFKTSFPLIALGAALQLVNELWNVHSQYNKMLRESSNKYYTAQLRIGEIDEIAKNDTRKALSSLVKEMNNEGFEIEIKPNISEKEAKEQFEEYKKQYTEFLEDIRKIEANYAENRKKGWLIGNDDIETDLDEYENAFYDFIAKGNKIQAELLRISEESTSLGKGAKEYIQELVKGKKEGENLIDYYKRLADYLEKLQNGVLFAGKKSSIASSFLGTKKDLEKDKEEATKEIREIFDSVNDEVIKGNKTREQFKILIDKGDFSKQWSDIKKQLAYDIYNLGDIKVPLRPGINQEDPQSNPKHERDILAERISLIKELNKEYEKLNKVMGSDKAAKTVMERYASQLKDVQMPKNIIGEAFLPNKENTAKALQELAKIITDFRKKIGAQKDANVLFDEKDADDFKKQLDKTKDNIESMFNSLDLHQKLKDAGLSEAEVQALFPGLAKTLDDVQKGIEAEYQKKFPKGEYLIADTDANKQYLADLNKLNQQRIKDSQDLVIELTKAYKTQLSDQLQLDRWYYEEKAKIAKANLTDEQKEQYNKNLTSQYNMKSDENAWKQFQESDFYIDLFQNLDNVSTKTLVAMRDKLAQMKEQLNDLQPSQVRAIVNNMEKLNEVLAGRNPFKELIPNLKSYIGSLKDRKKHEDAYLKALEKQEDIEKRLYGYTKTNEDGSKERVEGESEVLAKLESEYNAIVENKDATQAQKDEALAKLNVAKEVVKRSEEELANNKQITDRKKEQVDADKKKLDSANKSLSEVAKYGAEAVNAVSEFTGMLEGFGVEIPEWLEGTTEGLGQIFDGLESMDLTRPFSIVTGAFKTVTGIGKTIGSIFGIGSKDKKKEREIQRQIKNVELLGKKYDELKEKMESAWNSVTLHDKTKETIKNLDDQIASYRSMIKAEQDKKKTDKDRIKEWNDAIIELEKTKKEIMSQEQMDFGAIGGEKEYRSAAESFVQAWMDAFNETEDGLKSLNENFDDFIENLIVKQATMRLAQNRLKNLFEEIDKSVTESSAGGINLTKEELANIQSIGKTALEGLNEDLLALMETLGYKPNKKAELSALQQGIQSMSEETAGIIEGLLNSIRFFVSQQTTDISAIRALLNARYSLESEYSDANPMLVELRAQTGYLEILSDRIDRVFTTNVNSRGAALRVVMQ
jgi:chromosome segregation ATPase